MKGIKYFINEKLKLNSNTKLMSDDICDLYDGHSDKLKYINTEIELDPDIKKYSLDHIYRLLEILGIIIKNVNHIYQMIIQISKAKYIKVSCYSETYENLNHHDNKRVFLGNILIYDEPFTQKIKGSNVEFKQRDNQLFKPVTQHDKNIIYALNDFIQPINKNFIIYQNEKD